MTQPNLTAEAANAALGRIHTLLDGTDWDSSTMSEVAGVLTAAGFTIHGPGELDGYRYKAAVCDDPHTARRNLYPIDALNDAEALRIAHEKWGTDLAEVTVENDGSIDRTLWSVDSYEDEDEADADIARIIADPEVQARTLASVDDELASA